MHPQHTALLLICCRRAVAAAAQRELVGGLSYAESCVWRWGTHAAPPASVGGASFAGPGGCWRRTSSGGSAAAAAAAAVASSPGRSCWWAGLLWRLFCMLPLLLVRVTLRWCCTRSRRTPLTGSGDHRQERDQAASVARRCAAASTSWCCAAVHLPCCCAAIRPSAALASPPSAAPPRGSGHPGQHDEDDQLRHSRPRQGPSTRTAQLQPAAQPSALPNARPAPTIVSVPPPMALLRNSCCAPAAAQVNLRVKTRLLGAPHQSAAVTGACRGRSLVGLIGGCWLLVLCWAAAWLWWVPPLCRAGLQAHLRLPPPPQLPARSGSCRCQLAGGRGCWPLALLQIQAFGATSPDRCPLHYKLAYQLNLNREASVPTLPVCAAQYCLNESQERGKMQQTMRTKQQAGSRMPFKVPAAPRRGLPAQPLADRGLPCRGPARPTTRMEIPAPAGVQQAVPRHQARRRGRRRDRPRPGQRQHRAAAPHAAGAQGRGRREAPRVDDEAGRPLHEGGYRRRGALARSQPGASDGATDVAQPAAQHLHQRPS
jgi:hypothetical protein